MAKRSNKGVNANSLPDNIKESLESETPKETVSVVIGSVFTLSLMYILVALVIAEIKDIHGDIAERAVTMFSEKAKSLPQLEKEYVISEMDECLTDARNYNKVSNDPCGLKLWLPTNNESLNSMAHELMGICIKEYVMGAKTLTDLSMRNRNLMADGLSPFSVNEITQIELKVNLQ